MFKQIDAPWEQDQIKSGLSSGEGVIFHVRDEAGTDMGTFDKRLLVLETEFGSALRIMERDGNTLSGTLRQAWDSGTLRILSKNSPAVATGAHISIIGHISVDELRQQLTRIEMANGFANRFLWFCVRRSKALPDGGDLGHSVQPLIDQLGQAVESAASVDELHRDDEARTLWHAVYPALSEGRPGLFGTVTARAAAQVTRLQCIYAPLDGSSIINVQHLKAALAVWRYVEESVRYIFGSALGNPIADRLLDALRASSTGLTRTKIRDISSGTRARTKSRKRWLCLIHSASLDASRRLPKGVPWSVGARS